MILIATKKRNIESESERHVVIHKLPRKIKNGSKWLKSCYSKFVAAIPIPVAIPSGARVNALLALLH